MPFRIEFVGIGFADVVCLIVFAKRYDEYCTSSSVLIYLCLRIMHEQGICSVELDSAGIAIPMMDE